MRVSQGFTLIETILAAAIVAVVLIGLLSVALQSKRLATRGYREELAEILLLNVLEEVSEARFGDSRFSTGAPVMMPLEAYIDNRPQALEYQLQVAPGTNSTNAFFGKSSENYDVVEISASWRESTGSEGTLRPERRAIQVTLRRPGDGYFPLSPAH